MTKIYNYYDILRSYKITLKIDRFLSDMANNLTYDEIMREKYKDKVIKYFIVKVSLSPSIDGKYTLNLLKDFIVDMNGKNKRIHTTIIKNVSNSIKYCSLMYKFLISRNLGFKSIE